MSAASNGRVLRIALAGSLAVHLVVAAIIYSRPVTAAPQPKPEKSFLVHLPPPPPTPTPPPPKPALPQPMRTRTAVQPAIHRVHIRRIASRGAHVVPPPVEPTGDPNPYPIATYGPEDTAPTFAPIPPTPTPKPACSAPDIPAKTVVTESPDVPGDAAGYSGEAKVKVDLDASGNVVSANIYESTGSMELDRAAVAAAKASRYAPEERDCKNVSGSYLFVVDFAVQ